MIVVVKSTAQYRITAMVYTLYKHLKPNLSYRMSSRQLSTINQCLQLAAEICGIRPPKLFTYSP